MSPLDVAPYMALIVGIGVLVDSAEVLVARAALAGDGLYSYDVLRVGRRYLTAGRLARPLGRIFDYPAVLVLPTIQLVAATILLSSLVMPPGSRRTAVAAAALTAATARTLFYMRQQLGLDGADQMLSLVLLSCGLGSLLGNTPAGTAAVDYAGLQLLLSYLIAGSAKATSPVWRSGQAIIGITGTIGYGLPWVHSHVRDRPLLARLLCWSVIIFECSAVLLIFLGTPGAWAIITIGAAFHLGVALVMGLNVFVWAFAACYPSVLLIADQLSTMGATLHLGPMP